jgi:hypothetical protein
MKRLTLLSLIWFLLSSAIADAEVALIKNGKPLARIYTAEPQTEAIQEINYHFKKMSGAELEVVTMGEVQKPAIVLGSLAVTLGAKPGKTSPSQEGFRLVVKDGLVLIGGESDNGVLHGVHELLTRLGCDWVMPGDIGEIIPARKTLTLADTDETQVPAFQVRRLWYSGGTRAINKEESQRYLHWQKRQKGTLAPTPPSAVAGHAWDAFINRHKKEFAEDPTMLALRRMPDGTMKRSGPQLESTHPKVIDLFVQDIKDAFKKNNWPKDKEAGFGIGPADGLGYSQSVESMLAGANRVDPISGDPDVTDLVILLGNEILKRTEKEYPNIWLGYYVYSVHADYPARYKPHPRISLTVADISYSRLHDFEDTNSKTRAYYKSVVEQWSKLSKEQGNPLYFRGYNWNLAENLVPFTRLKIWGVDLPIYHKLGFRGLNVEAQKMWAINGPHDYLFMKLAWDASLDWKKVLTRYCKNSFGTGGPAMERYFLRTVDQQHKAGQEAGSYHAIHLVFDQAYVAAADKDLQTALTAATTEPDRTRIRYIQTGHEALKKYLAFHDAMVNFDFPTMKKNYEDILDHWEKTHATNSDLSSKVTLGYLKRFLGKFVEESNQYATSSYRMILKLPDELPTMFDPFASGHRLRFHSPDLNDLQFVKTRTFSTTWDAQGLGSYRSGAVWYRFHFQLPANVRGQPIGLFLGGFDDEARVWINGQLVGTSGRRFRPDRRPPLWRQQRPGHPGPAQLQCQRAGHRRPAPPLVPVHRPAPGHPRPGSPGAPPYPPRRRPGRNRKITSPQAAG